MLTVLYLLAFISPQVLIYLYLWGRLPDPRRPERARALRVGLLVVFTLANIPWLLVAHRVLFGSIWSVGRIPWIAPWMAWQVVGWGYCLLVAVSLLVRGIWWLARRVRGPSEERGVAPGGAGGGAPILSRRQFFARATYSYFAAGTVLSAYGIWSAERLPQLTRRTLRFPDLPAALDGLTLLHLSDVHAGIHMEEEKMRALVAQANALRPDLIVQTGDMIDISARYIPAYVRTFRELRAPLGVVTVLGNHDRYTGEEAVARGVRDAGQVLIRNGAHVIEHRGATLALLGITDPHHWKADDPQPEEIDLALAAAPPDTFRVLLAHRPGAFDGAAPRGIPLTLAGHIHGGQLYIPAIGWSAGSMITKYVMGHFRRGASQLYVSRGIGVVGVPIRIFTPPEIALFTLERGTGSGKRET